MKQKVLDAKTFGELLESVREGGAILRGLRKPSRRFVVEASGVRGSENERAFRNWNSQA